MAIIVPRQTIVQLFACILLAFALQPDSARAVPSAQLRVTFTPDIPGQSTNVGFAVAINAPPGSIPPPLTDLDLDYPSALGLALSGLGLDTCPEPTLEQLGPDGCPVDSRMGQGRAVAEL
jgi:hypothetical protein